MGNFSTGYWHSYSLWFGCGKFDPGSSVFDRSFSCIYYPLTTLPEWMQSIAVLFQLHMFLKGCVPLLIKGVFVESLMVKGFILNFLPRNRSFCFFYIFSSRPETRTAPAIRRVEYFVPSCQICIRLHAKSFLNSVWPE